MKHLLDKYAQIERALCPYGPNPTPAEYAHVFSRFARKHSECLYLLICLGIGRGAITQEAFKSIDGLMEREAAAKVCSLVEGVISPEVLEALLSLMAALKERN